jgi:drug/metabolite transporter (DMT)-like permease
MEVVLALGSALLFALGTALQQQAGAAAPSTGADASLLLRMARRPVWVAGIAADGVGFVTQAAALGVGRLAVVQPLLITSVVFALPLGMRLTGQRIRRAEMVSAALIVAALAAFVSMGSASGGHQEAPLHAWLLAALVCAAVCTPLVMLARRGPRAQRAALLGAAAGILFALSAALTKAVVDELHAGLLPVLDSWELYALIVVGYISMTLNQLALNTGALAATLAASTALDPVAGVVLGITLFGESLRAGALPAVVTVGSLLGALAAMTVLARAESPPQPADDADIATEHRPLLGER